MSAVAHTWRLVLAEPAAVRTRALVRDEPWSPAPGVELTVRGGKLELKVDPRGATRALLNDVQVAGFTQLHPGDQLQLPGPGLTVLVARSTAPVTRAGPVQWKRDEWRLRLGSECARARHTHAPLAVAVGLVPPETPSTPADQPALEWAPLGSGVFLALVVGADPRGQAALEEWVGASGGRIGWARRPEDGREPDALIASALGSFEPGLASPDGEPLASDPTTVRLRALLERWAVTPGLRLLLWGEPSSGRGSWARWVLDRAGEPWRAYDGRRPERAPSEAEVAGRGVLLQRLDALGEGERRAWLRSCARAHRVVATAEQPLDEGFGAEVFVPALRDRPGEVLPLAMRALERARAALGRRGLSFNAEVRQALQAWTWPGNVRELENAVTLAALTAESDELRAANLPGPVASAWRGRRHGAAAEDLRTALKAAEKDALLKALGRSAWNVTRAAKELGLPRRTVVYRMARLGLRRPER